MNKKHIYILFFIILVITAPFFLQDGLFLYLDMSYEPINKNMVVQLYYAIFYTFQSQTSFGFDMGQILSPRILQYMISLGFHLLAGHKFAIILILFSNYLLTFYFSYKILHIIYDNKNTAFISALFFAFNPASLFLINEIGFIYAYPSLLLVTYSAMVYYKDVSIIGNKNIYRKNLFGLCTGLLLLITYTRIFGLYLFLLLFLFFIYFSKLKKLFLYKKTYLYILILVIVTVPYTFNIYFDFINIAGINQGNYAKYGIQFNQYLYNNGLSLSPILGFSLGEISPNYSGFFQRDFVFKFFSTFFLIIFLFIGLNFKKGNGVQKKVLFIGYFLVLLSTCVIISPHLFDLPLYTNIIYKYIPFLANEPRRIYLYMVIGYTLIIGNSINLYKKYNNIISLLIYGYIGLSLFPFLTFFNNQKLSSVPIESIPSVIYNKILYTGFFKENTRFIQGSNLLFKRAPYPIELGTNTKFKEPLTSNPRVVAGKQVELFTYLLSKKTFEISQSILGIKNFFIFKNIRNAKPGEFDFFSTKDYELESKKFYNDFLSNTGLILVDNNTEFAHFRPVLADQYEYFFYSPLRIYPYEISQLGSTGSLDIYSRPILVDSGSYNRPANISPYIHTKGKNETIGQNIKISYKQSPLNATKIYAKLENVDTSTGFLLQLNQTFGPAWKMKWVDQSYFDEKACTKTDPENNNIQRNGLREYFPITNNSRCTFETKLLELEDIRLLSKPEVAETQHFEGNFIGNAWYIRPQDIPQNMKNQKTLYAVFIYEKQIYYSYALLISLLTFLFLIFMAVKEYICKKKIY